MRLYLLILTLVGAVGVNAQHTTLLGNYYTQPLLSNPAFAGNRGALSAEMMYRHQWYTMTAAPVQQYLAASTLLKDSRMGVGLYVNKESIGLRTRTEIRGLYSYKLKWPGQQLVFGLSMGLRFSTSYWETAKLQDIGDPLFMGSEQQVRGAFGVGAFYQRDLFWVGLSLPDLLPEFTRGASVIKNMQYVLTTGWTPVGNDDFDIGQSGALYYSVNSGIQAEVNLLITYRDFLTLGPGVRFADALLFNLRIQPLSQLRIGYVYESGISELATYHQGSHELFLSYDFKYETSAVNPRSF